MRKTNSRQVYSARSSCIAMMEKKLFLAFFSLLVILEITSSFPLFRTHADQFELGSVAESNKLQTRSISETPMQRKSDVLSKFVRIQRSSKPGRDHDVHRRKHHRHGLSYHLSKDQSKTPNFTKRMGQKFLAILIFLGCLAFMSVVFGIACCKYRRDQNKRVKKATEVDVQSREDVPQQVSTIEYADVDVENHDYYY